MGFPWGQKEFMCDQIWGKIANEMSLYLLFRGFFPDCCYCNILLGWGVWALNHSLN